MGYSAHFDGSVSIGTSVRWNLIEGIQALSLLPDNPNSGSAHSFVAARDITPEAEWLAYSAHTKVGGAGVAAGLASGDGTNVTAPSSLPGGEVIRHASQITDDGLIVFGWGVGLDFNLHSVRWSLSDGFQVLVEPAGFTNSLAEPRAVSGDGASSAGDMWAYDENFAYAAYEAYRWTANEGMQGIGYLPGGRVAPASAFLQMDLRFSC